MNNIKSDSIPVIKSNISFRSIGDETILLNLDNNIYYSLNNTGRFIWSKFDGISDIEKIANIVVAEFKVNALEAKFDLIELTQDLVNEEFIIIK